MYSPRVGLAGITSASCPNGMYSGFGCDPVTVIDEAEGYSWKLINLGPGILLNQDKALKLTVHQNDHPQNAMAPLSRTEITYLLTNENNRTYYYSWRVYIPNDSEFVDEDGGWHMLAQVLSAEQDINGNPVTQRKILAFTYAHDENSFHDDRMISFLLSDLQSSNFNKKRYRVNVPDGIKKGEWNEIVCKVNWSPLDMGTFSPGSYEFWVNRKPLVINSSSTSNGTTTFLCGYGNMNDPNEVFELSNVVTSNQGHPAYNYFKFGSYRSPQVKTVSTYTDDVRISYDFPPEKNKTHLINEYCDKSFELGEDLKLIAHEVGAATDYKFRLSQNGVPIYYLNSQSVTPEVSLKWINGGETYDVDVKAMINGSYQLYGKTCQITLPSNTKVMDDQCAQTLSTAELLYGYPIGNANNYKFRFVNLNTNAHYWRNSNNSNHWVSLNGIPNGIYAVQVRVQGVDFDFNYGQSCIITILQSRAAQNTGESLSLNSNTPILYPNPVRKSFKMAIEKNIINLKIYSATTSALVHQEKNVLPHKEIFVSNLKRGLYFVFIQTEDGLEEIHKMIKE